METDYGAEKDNGTCSARWRRSAMSELPRSLFPQRAPGRDEHHAGRPLRARQDGQLMGRRHGPDPVHADQLSSTTPSIFPATASRHLDQRAGRARLDRQLSCQGSSGKRGLPWGFEVIVPQGFDTMKSRGSFAEWAKLGVRRADGKPFPPTGDGILFFPSGANGPGFHRHGEFRRAQGVQQLRCLRDRGRPSRRPDARRRADQGRLAGATTARCRATSASRCRRNWPRSATRCPTSKATSISTCATISAPSRRRCGMVPDGNPTAALLERLGVKVP